MERYGLLGKSLSHSYSKLIHEQFFDCEYDLIELSEEELTQFLTEKAFRGVNVTIPYKCTVLPFLSKLSDSAKKIGAVNTIVNENGSLKGYNTDYDGFLATINKQAITVCGKKVLVLGNGGAAKAVFSVLSDLSAGEIVVVKSHPEKNTVTYEEAARYHSDAAVLINTSPVGMYPNIDASPICLTPYRRLTAVVDLIYNPSETKLCREASSLGIKAVNGLFMLVAQAYYASELFHAEKPKKSIEDVLSMLSEKMK